MTEQGEVNGMRRPSGRLTGMILALALGGTMPAHAQSGGSEGMQSMPVAVLQGLDKVTARVVSLVMPPLYSLPPALTNVACPF